MGIKVFLYGLIFTLFQQSNEMTAFNEKINSISEITQENQRFTALNSFLKEKKSWLKSIDCQKLKETEINQYISHLHLLSAYTQNPVAADYMLACLTSLDKPAAEDTDLLFRAFISTRQFTKASDFKKKHPSNNLPPSPKLTGSSSTNSPNVYQLQQENQEWVLQEHSLKYSEDTQIIVIAHPLCHFTQEAVKSIDQSPELSNIFKNHSLWLVPAYDALDLTQVHDWNQQHPNQYLKYMAIRHDFLFADSFATPTFYFIKGGKLQAKLTGWPDDEQIKPLQELVTQYFSE